MVKRLVDPAKLLVDSLKRLVDSAKLLVALLKRLVDPVKLLVDLLIAWWPKKSHDCVPFALHKL